MNYILEVVYCFDGVSVVYLVALVGTVAYGVSVVSGRVVCTLAHSAIVLCSLQWCVYSGVSTVVYWSTKPTYFAPASPVP